MRSATGTMKLGPLVVLLAVGLLGLACGESASTPAVTTPTGTSATSPVVLSGIGKATSPGVASDAGKVHLEAGSYIVSWQSLDKKFFAFCGLASNADYGITIGLSAEPTNPKLVEDLVGGDYQCQVSAIAGSAWTITFTRA